MTPQEIKQVGCGASGHRHGPFSGDNYLKQTKLLLPNTDGYEYRTRCTNCGLVTERFEKSTKDAADLEFKYFCKNELPILILMLAVICFCIYGALFGSH